LAKYRNGFEPTFHPEELKKKFKPGDFVGVALMGDLAFASPFDLAEIFAVVGNFPQTNFLIQSKDPSVFSRPEFAKLPNVYYGTTLETNRLYGYSKAPSPASRFIAFNRLPVPHKFLSIEPIMDFDLGGFVHWLEMLRPEIVEVGADNYKHHLNEPPWWKVEALLEELRRFVPNVVEKDGLERLRQEIPR
jgi:hypothetical protein